MRNTCTALSALTLALFTTAGANAQSLVSGFMAGKGHGSVVISGTTEQYKNVFLVPEKVKGVPIFEEVRVSSLNLYGTYGLTDKIDAILSIPFIRSEGKADPR